MDCPLLVTFITLAAIAIAAFVSLPFAYCAKAEIGESKM